MTIDMMIAIVSPITGISIINIYKVNQPDKFISCNLRTVRDIEGGKVATKTTKKSITPIPVKAKAPKIANINA